ncbi:CbtA family protein [Nocardioides jensenii]|uniref:CbtA family protein n=1 Tax=Nocardioides jensenii TaxID=1843 RepID=UPI00082CAB23|nr:CbtA family protein [Nocardioides jensenii]
MTARNILIRGLLAGFIAGIFGFLVAHQVGEPHVEKAIALEEAGSADEAEAPEEHGHDEGTAHEHDAEEAGGAAHEHSHGEEAEVSRGNQRTWGLLTGTLIVGTALGGLIALISAAAIGRIGRLRPAASTALVTAVGFVSFALVPFLKYPAAPPAVGSGDTIGERTGYYFIFLAISVLAAVAATFLARHLLGRVSVYASVVIGAGAYLAVVVLAAIAMPTVNELGDFPADTLWYFRLSSLFTLATIWGVIGVVLTGLVGRLDTVATARAERRELAASI